MTSMSVAVRMTRPEGSPRSRTAEEASANATAPRRPETKSAFWWLAGTLNRSRARHAFVARVIG